MVRQMEFADHDFDVDAEIVFAAEDFDDAAARVLSGLGQSVISTSTTTPSRSASRCGGQLLRRERDQPICSSASRVLCGEASNRSFSGHRGHRGFWEFLPSGITISCVIFVSIGVTSFFATVVEDSDYGGMGAVDGADDAAFGAAVGADILDSTSTRSPCMALPIWCGGMKMSPASLDFRAGDSDFASGITKPKPSRCMVRRPATRFLSAAAWGRA